MSKTWTYKRPGDFSDQDWTDLTGRLDNALEAIVEDILEWRHQESVERIKAARVCCSHEYESACDCCNGEHGCKARVPRGAVITYGLPADFMTGSSALDEYSGYVSFGTYNEDSGLDSFGIHDERIYYYCDSLQELQAMLRRDEPIGDAKFVAINEVVYV